MTMYKYGLIINESCSNRMLGALIRQVDVISRMGSLFPGFSFIDALVNTFFVIKSICSRDMPISVCILSSTIFRLSSSSTLLYRFL